MQQRQVPTVHTLLVQFLVKVDVPVVVQRQVRGSMLQKTVVCPQLQFAALLHPCRGAEADLHGPDYSSDHRGPTSGKTSSGRSSIMMRELILRLNSSTWRSSLQSSIIAWAVWHVVNYGVLGPDSQAIRGLYAVVQLALMVQTVLKPVQFSVMNVDMPAAGQRLALMVQTAPKPVEFPQVQFWDEVVFMPVVGQRLALMVQTVPKPVEFPQVQLLDKMLCPWWNDRLYGPDVQKTVVFHSCRSSQVVVIPVVSRCRFPWSSCSEDHGDSTVAVFFVVVDAPVAHVVLDMPVVVQRQVGIAQTVQPTVWKYRRCSTLRLWTSLWSRSDKFPALPGGASDSFIVVMFKC